MVSSVNSLLARTLDRGVVTRPIDDRRTLAFTREAVNSPDKSEAKAPRSFGAQERKHPSTAGFLRQAPAKAENKDEMPGLIGDIATHTKNSALEFIGATVQRAPSSEQALNATKLALQGLSGAGAGVLIGDTWSAMSGHSLSPEARGVLVGAVAVLTTVLSPVLSHMNSPAPDPAVPGR